MRRIGLAAAAALVLAACNPSAPSGEGGAAGGAPSVFPNLFQAAYRAEATITNPESGQTMPVVIVRDGQKVRMEMNGPQGAMVVISNPETGETFSIISGGGRQMAIRANTDDVSDPNRDWTAEAGTTFVGPCSVGSESGNEWTRTDENGTSTGCVTQDGIILRAAQNGQTTWETTSISRGPQDASLFALPAGVEVMDLSNMRGNFKIPGQ
ncbi:hypothetical protein U91I_01366 [alpha proteobacterium U9-1i]|nr:hypothetical protein U91I_01366 [alpha proteobacterium U9-1i]